MPELIPRRRFLAGAVRLSIVAASGFSLSQAHAQPSYTVTTAQLQDAITKRFPIRKRANGLLDFTIQAPQLRMLLDQNRLGAAFAIEAAGPALGRAYPGTFDLDFGLRYEPTDRSIRADQPRVNTLQFQGMSPQAATLLAAYGPQLAEQALNGAILHQFKQEDLALPDSMGVQPGSITVTDKGLVIGFINKLPG